MHYIGRAHMNCMKKITTLLIICVLIIAGCSKKNSDDDPRQIANKAGNLLDSGDSANDILSNEDFTKIKIEIAYVSGFRPTSSAINDFVAFIQKHTFKNDIEIVYQEQASPNEADLTLEEIVDLEAENRTVYNDGDTLGIYIYFTDAPSSKDRQDEGLVNLGVVYRNTSMVIYETTVQLLSNQSSSISVADIESATLNHEFGHLMGLVNLGSPPVNPHEDSENANHCNQPGCLMRAELQFDGAGRSSLFSRNDENNALKPSCSISGKSIMKMLETAHSRGLDNAVPIGAECTLDLQANGGR